MAAQRPRLRLDVDSVLMKGSARLLCWYELPEGVDTIKQLRHSIARHCNLTPGASVTLQLYLDGFALLLSSSTSVLRENDLVTVTAKGGLLEPVVESPPVAPALLLLPAPATKGTKKRAAAAAQPASVSNTQPAKKRRVVAAVKEPTALPAKPPVAQVASSSDSSSSDGSSESSDSSSSEDEASSDDTPAAPTASAEPKKASRNARRKAAKRRLRRQGVLPAKPRSSGLKATALQEAAAASPLDPNGSARKLPAAPLPAPVHAAPETGTPGHFYFQDSDGEENSGGRPRAGAGAVVVPDTYTAATSQAPEPRGRQISEEYAELPLPPPPPRRHAAVAPQPAAGAEQRAPAPRASTLAEVYAARGRASAANVGANGSGRQPSNPPVSRQEGDMCIPWDYSAGESAANPVLAAKRRHVRSPQHHSEALPLLKRRPIGGDVIAYKLLEIGGDFTPQVSEYRLGKVSVFEPEGGSMRVVPWPDHTLHPVLAEQALADGYDYYEEPASDDEDAEEEPPSEYDSSGVLDTAWASLQEVRLMTAANDAPPNTAAAPTSVQRPSPVSAAHEIVTPAEPLPDQGYSAAASPSIANGAVNYLDRQRKRPSLPTLAQLQSQPRPEVLTPTAVKVGGLGPPRRDPGLPSSGLTSAPRASGWADVSSALQLRRAELAAKQAAERIAAEEARERKQATAPESVDHGSGMGATAVTPSNMQKVQKMALRNSRVQEDSGTPNGINGQHSGIADVVKPVGVATRSAVRPRGGARQGALGPFLARLRAAQDRGKGLDNQLMSL